MPMRTFMSPLTLFWVGFVSYKRLILNYMNYPSLCFSLFLILPNLMLFHYSLAVSKHKRNWQKYHNGKKLRELTTNQFLISVYQKCHKSI